MLIVCSLNYVYTSFMLFMYSFDSCFQKSMTVESNHYLRFVFVVQENKINNTEKDAINHVKLQFRIQHNYN